jgi:hypothetical protein
MNLKQVRQKFRDLSGRFDLVNEDYTDNGADFFINSGMKYLDRLTETQKSWGTFPYLLGVGEYLVKFPYCRAVKEVWVATTTAQWQLEKKRLQDIQAGYGTGLISSLTSGTPLYFSPCISRYIPEDATPAELALFAPYIEIPTGITGDMNALILNIPTDEIMVVSVKGLFYSMELVGDTDSNYWTEVHPLLLYMAAMRAIEVVNRSTQGVNDWTNAINSEVIQLGMDLVDEVIAEQDQIED